jgi:hypothetical protein
MRIKDAKKNFFIIVKNISKLCIKNGLLVCFFLFKNLNVFLKFIFFSKQSIIPKFLPLKITIIDKTALYVDFLSNYVSK